MKDLTKAEEEVMRILWRIEKGFIKDILAEFPDPKPAYNTVSTIVRILEKKEIVAYTAFGKAHQYYPLLSQQDYTSGTLNSLLSNYFDGSVSKLLSFFARDKKLSTQELNDIIKKIEQHD